MLKRYLRVLLDRDFIEDFLFLTEYLTDEEIIGYFEFFNIDEN